MRTAFAFVLAVSSSAAAFAGQRPFPPKASLDAAKRLVAETYRKELSAADKAPAIKAMLELAAQTEGDDPAQAALYLGAAEVAARAVLKPCNTTMPHYPVKSLTNRQAGISV